MKKRILSIFLIFALMLLGGCSIDSFTTTNDYRYEISQRQKYLDGLNEISINFMSSNIMVLNHYYSVNYSGEKTVENVGQGSGAIFKRQKAISGFKYFLLTNYHVTQDYLSFKKYFTVVDFKDNEMQAELVFQDDNYDLAVVSFNSNTEYNVCEFASSDPLTGDAIFAVGQPLGQRNSITFGSVSQYIDTTYNWAKINFPCIVHTAHIDKGSSGGILLNADIKLCGINFAAGSETDFFKDTKNVSLSVPIEKVKECLTKHSITY